jgi:hypothetical protein
MKLDLKDLVVVALLVLGMLSDFNFIDVPFWVFIVIGSFYAGIWSGWALNKTVKE